jgi:hypothetical protein
MLGHIRELEYTLTRVKKRASGALIIEAMFNVEKEKR